MEEQKEKYNFIAISLGGGVQSTVMTLMADSGIIQPMPDVAIFADTKWEPDYVYENIEWLKKEVKNFPIETVDIDRNLRDDVYNGINHTNNLYVNIPAYFVEEETGKKSINRRQCTTNYKIIPIYKAIRGKIGMKRKNNRVQIWLGISTNEIGRIKPSVENG